MVIGSDVLQVKQWIREALQAHHEGKFIQPQKSYLFTTDNPYDRIISLPAAFLGDPRMLGVKWIGSHSKNFDRGLDRAHAIIILNDPETHAAAVVMEGTLVSSARTLAVSLIVIDQFAPRPRRVGVIGMGRLGRMHHACSAVSTPQSVSDQLLQRTGIFRSARQPTDQTMREPTGGRRGLRGDRDRGCADEAVSRRV